MADEKIECSTPSIFESMVANKKARASSNSVKIKIVSVVTGLTIAICFALKLGMGIQSLILLNDAERTPEDEHQFFLTEAILDLTGAGLVACFTCALIGGAAIHQYADDSE